VDGNVSQLTKRSNLFQAHLNIARNAQDRAGMGRAFGNIGNAYSASGFFEQVKQILKIMWAKI
jgi:hypothetical protein